MFIEFEKDSFSAYLESPTEAEDVKTNLSSVSRMPLQRRMPSCRGSNLTRRVTGHRQDAPILRYVLKIQGNKFV